MTDIRGSSAEIAFCDRGFRGRKKMGKTAIVLPESPSPKASEHFKRKAQKNFGRRSAIEPIIGHLKSDFRVARNYFKGAIGNAINLLMAAAAFNGRKWMRDVVDGLIFVLFSLWTIRSQTQQQEATREYIRFLRVG